MFWRYYNRLLTSKQDLLQLILQSHNQHRFNSYPKIKDWDRVKLTITAASLTTFAYTSSSAETKETLP